MLFKQTFLKLWLPNVVAGTACLMVQAAAAQWQWLDKDGRKVFSDRAPPSEVLEKNIVKRPRGVQPVAPAADATMNPNGTLAAAADTVQSPPAASAASGEPKLSALDKELIEKKKKAADAEAAKRRADEDRVAKARLDNCVLGKQAKASLDSGLRVARTNAKGEREILDDAARTAEVQRVQNIIDGSCR